MEQLSSHLAANLAELNARFGQSADFYAKELELYHCKGAIVLFDGMASLKGLWQLLLDAASRRTPPGPAEQLTGEQVFALLFEHSALPAEPDPCGGLGGPDPADDSGHGSAIAGRMRKRYRLFGAEPERPLGG